MFGIDLPDDPDQLAQLQLDTKLLPARSIIYREGEAYELFHTLLEGWAVRFRRTLDGQRQVLGFLLPGDPLGLAGLCAGRMPFTVQALTDVRLCLFARQAIFDYLTGDPRRASRLATLAVREWALAEDRLVDLGRRSATERIALFILQLQARLAARGMVDQQEGFAMPIRQQDMADALGLTPIHVSRVLTDLRRRELISLGRKMMQIHDRRGLIDIAGVSEADVDRAVAHEAASAGARGARHPSRPA